VYTLISGGVSVDIDDDDDAQLGLQLMNMFVYFDVKYGVFIVH